MLFKNIRSYKEAKGCGAMETFPTTAEQLSGKVPTVLFCLSPKR